MINFFKKFRKKPEQKKEIVNLGNAKNKVKEILGKFEEREKYILDEIKSKIEWFVREMLKQEEVVRELNLENRKEDRRLKERVLDNKNVYIEHCKKLVEEISRLQKDSPEDFFRALSQIAVKFENSSRRSFEIATILIGKELAEIKKIIREFFVFQEKLYSENKKMFFDKETMKKIIEDYNFLNNLKEQEKEIENELKFFEDSLKRIGVLVKKQEQEILDFKNTEQFRNFMSEIKKQKNLENDLIKRAENLRDNLNLKDLLRDYHQNEKLRELIREYRNNFLKAMFNDKENLFFSVIPEEKSEQISEIKKEFSKIGQGKSDIEKKEEGMENELEKFKQEIFKIEKQEQESKKKIKKIKEKEQEKINGIKKDLEKIGFNVD